MKKLIISIALAMLQTIAIAQNPKLAVISFDANATEFRANELTELLRIEISKHKTYEMIDRYEVQEMLTAAEINPSSCFSKTCILQAAEVLKLDKAVSGSLDKLGDALFVRLRMVNPTSKAIEKEVVREFLYIPNKINTMISICVNELLGIENDAIIINSLSNRESYESAINNPYYQTLDLSGPRMGFTYFTGSSAELLKRSKSEGGYDAYPMFFQMGYQFEKQYLNEGQYQALFEFIPMISGVDQGLFIPSLTVMNGIRSNKNGLEFAVGPSVNMVSKAKMYEENGEWILASEKENINALPEVYRADSRGSAHLKTYVVLAAGYSLKSGKLNIPINAYVVPSRNDFRFGLSFGFNARR